MSKVKGRDARINCRECASDADELLEQFLLPAHSFGTFPLGSFHLPARLLLRSVVWSRAEVHSWVASIHGGSFVPKHD
jgi:hypothetical protein